MPALSFQKQFGQKILDGSKTFTLRELRKDGRDPKTGQTLFLFTGQRTKQCKKIGEKLCRFAAMARLGYASVKITGFEPLTEAGQCERFAWADGFVNYNQFRQFHKIQTNNTVRELWLIAWVTRAELAARLGLILNE